MIYADSPHILSFRDLPSSIRLTGREQQLLDYAAKGRTDRQIGDDLAISIETVASYWRGIRLKFQASSRTECVARYSDLRSKSSAVQHQLESAEMRKEIQERTEAHAREQAQKNMLAAITNASLSYITHKTTLKQCFEGLLKDVLDLTLSHYGFMGELDFCGEKACLLEHAFSDVATNRRPGSRVDADHDSLDLTSLRNVYAKVVATGKVAMSNGTTDSASPERLSLSSFLGIPVYSGEQLVGLIALAKRDGAYTQESVDFLAPLVATCSNFIVASRMERERERMLQQIADSEALVRDLVDRIPAGLLYETPAQTVAFVNQTLLTMFGLPFSADQLIGTSCAENSKRMGPMFVDPIQYLARIEEIIEKKASVKGDVIDLVDGRRVERDFEVISSNGVLRGYLWCYRDVTRNHFTRKTDRQAA